MKQNDSNSSQNESNSSQNDSNLNIKESKRAKLESKWEKYESKWVKLSEILYQCLDFCGKNSNMSQNKLSSKLNFGTKMRLLEQCVVQ